MKFGVNSATNRISFDRESSHKKQESSSSESENLYDNKKLILKKFTSMQIDDENASNLDDETKASFFTKFLEKADVVQIAMNILEDEDDLFD